MKNKILVGGAVLLALLLALHLSTKRQPDPTTTREASRPALPPPAPLSEIEAAELQRLEGMIEGGSPQAAELLADSLDFLQLPQRQRVLEGYWMRILHGETGTRSYEPVLRRFWDEVRPFVLRSIARGGVDGIRALHVLESLQPQGQALSRDFVGAVGSALVRGLATAWEEQEALRPQRAAALRLVSRYRLRALEKELVRLARQEVQLDLRRKARETWEGLTGKRWPPE